LHTQSTEIYFI